MRLAVEILQNFPKSEFADFKNRTALPNRFQCGGLFITIVLHTAAF